LILSEASEPSPPLVIPSHATLDPPLIRLTKSSSKDHGTSSNSYKKLGPGRKSTKQHKDENAQKDIAMGTQTPIKSYILGQHDKETNHKDQVGQAPLRTPNTQ